MKRGRNAGFTLMPAPRGSAHRSPPPAGTLTASKGAVSHYVFDYAAIKRNRSNAVNVIDPKEA